MLGHAYVCQSMCEKCGLDQFAFMHVSIEYSRRVPYVRVYICSPMAGNQSQVSRILLCSSSYHCLETRKRVYWMCRVCTCGGSAVGRAVYSEQQGVKFNLGVNFMVRNSGEENSYCITEVLGSPFYCGYHGYRQHAKIPS